MKRILFCFLLATVAFNAFPQLGPGYMGKRCTIGYGFSFSPTLFGSNGSEESFFGRGNSPGGDLAFNSAHTGLFEFAFKNRTSVGLSCTFFKTTFDNYQTVTAYYTDNQGYGSYLEASPTGFYTIKGLNCSLYFKFYHKRYVAPWGRYFLLGPTVNINRCFYDPSIMYVTSYDQSYKVSDFGPQGQAFFRGDITFGFGRSRILFNRVTLDYGINFQLLALMQVAIDPAGGQSITDWFSGEDITTANYFERTSGRRGREVNRVNAFIKVGYLLF